MPKVYIVFSCEYVEPIDAYHEEIAGVYADENDALARVAGLEDAYMVECTVQ